MSEDAFPGGLNAKARRRKAAKGVFGNHAVFLALSPVASPRLRAYAFCPFYAVLDP